MTAVNNRVITTQPKTAKSRRTLFVDPKTVDVLREHRRQQREAIVAAGSAWNRDLGLVFCDAIGEPIHPDRYSREFVVMTRVAHLPEIRLHDYADVRVMPTLARWGQAGRPSGRLASA